MFIIDGLEALGTKWWVEVFDDLSVSPTEIHLALQTLLQDFEKTYSRFSAHSLVSRLNKKRTLTHIPDDMRAMLELGMHVEKVSGVAVTGTALLDLGGVGKGYMIKKLAQELREVHHIQEFLINGGGDLYATMEQGRSIPITIEHPLQKNITYKEIELYNSAVCVSSPIKRSWTSPQTGKTYSHIVDRQQGAQLHRKQGSIVSGPDPALCDALATTACLIDPEVAHMLEKAFNVAIEIVSP